MSEIEHQHLLGKARDAKRGGQDAWSVQSTGEKADMKYALAEAIDRTG